MMKPKVFTVSQLNSRVAELVETAPDLQMIFIEGELSNLSPNRYSGHLYFSLKDSKSVVRAVMFKSNVQRLRFAPEDGMKVIIRARVVVYEPSGQYQLRVEDMQPDGVGVLAMQLEQLKKKLGAEGLFDPAHKQPIPKSPKTVGVITSPTGAAVQDIINILTRRCPQAQIVLAPVMVQGDTAPEQLVRAVNTFSHYNAADVLIIGRGGGSMEDLWAFNDEGLARAIYACRIPVISAVGHETDVTICDFVSDLRAPTPSAAAELAVPNIADIRMKYDAMLRRIQACMNRKLALRDRDCTRLKSRADAYSPVRRSETNQSRMDALSVRAHNAVHNRYQQRASLLQELFAKSEALDPRAVLDRGFAYINRDGEAVTSVAELQAGDTLNILFKDGSVSVTVNET